MLNYLWCFMILVGIAFAAVTGNLEAVTQAALDSAKEAITLGITMLGVMAFWCGMMRIAQEAGIIRKATRLLRPLLTYLFPYVPKDHAANEHIATNMIANIFGLGWAATPAGLKAMEELAHLEEDRRESEKDARSCIEKESCHKKGTKKYQKRNLGYPRDVASDEMCTFLIINISSLQLIPINIIAYRSQYGSVNPTAIVGPALVATLISTLAGIVFCKLACSKRKML